MTSPIDNGIYVSIPCHLKKCQFDWSELKLSESREKQCLTDQKQKFIE